MDDCYLTVPPVYVENVDYMAHPAITNHHLYLCWRRNRSIKNGHEDICLTIPLSALRRLENTCWRRWFKQLRNLAELPPCEINWNKDKDITWLYGPRYHAECPFDQTAPQAVPKKYEYEEHSETLLVNLRAGSMIFDELLLEEEEDEYSPIPSAIRRGGKRKKTRVRFSYIVSLREFVNGILFDYDFLDALCL